MRGASLDPATLTTAIIAIIVLATLVLLLQSKLRALRALSRAVSDLAHGKAPGAAELPTRAAVGPASDDLRVLQDELKNARGAAGRDALLRAMYDVAPAAILVYGDNGDIVSANKEACELFF